MTKQKRSNQALTDDLEAIKQREGTTVAQLTKLKADLAAAQAAAQEAEQASSSVKANWQTAERSLQAEKETLQVSNTRKHSNLRGCLDPARGSDAAELAWFVAC